MKYRSKPDILASILRAVMDESMSGVTAYRIMFKADISFRQSEEYLGMLVRGRLLEYDGTTRVYRITERGL
jgi:predicted transcriptional regulator